MLKILTRGFQFTYINVIFTEYIITELRVTDYILLHVGYMITYETSISDISKLPFVI